MTGELLPWLLLLSLAAIAAVPAVARGGAVARFVVLAFGLAALHAGVGDLASGAIRDYATASAGGALFVSLTAGLLLGGTTPWPPRAWRSWVAGLPLAAAAVWVAWPALRVGPWLLGAVIGAVPVLLGSAFPAPARPRSASATGSSRRTGWLVLALSSAVVLLGPLAIVLLAPVAALAIGFASGNRLPGGRRQLVMPAIAALAAGVLGWLALTIAGDALTRLAGFFAIAPVSPAAERWLALLAVVIVFAMLAPWPLSRFGLGVALAPAATILAYRLSLSLAPGAIGDWLPLLGMILVPLAVVAAARGRWPEALAMVAVLAALGPGTAALVGATAAVGAAVALAATRGARNLLRPERVTFAGAWWLATLAAAGIAAATAATLEHEVVLATLLAGGLAIAAARARPDPT